MSGSSSTIRMSRPGFGPTPFLYPGTGPEVSPASCARSKILHYGKIRPPLADGGPCRIRTCGLRIRSPTLYPTELRALRPTVAEREGFEPSIQLWAVYWFSKPAPSASRPPLPISCNSAHPRAAGPLGSGVLDRALLGVKEIGVA